MATKMYLVRSTAAALYKFILRNILLRSTAVSEKDMTFYPQIFESELCIPSWKLLFMRGHIPWMYSLRIFGDT